MTLNLKNRFLLFLAIITTSVMIFYFIPVSNPQLPTFNVIKKQTFLDLSRSAQERKVLALNYLKKQKRIALSLSENKKILASFNKISELYATSRSDNKEFNKIDYGLQEFFVYNLASFYDMLFINKEGDIFYTVKKENDYKTNINNIKYKGSSLQKTLDTKNFAFVDYELYEASKEPASFYIIPLRDKSSRYKGSIILQISINQINDIFTNRSDLGRTGEVYLVNKNQSMLTDSRFIDQSTILQQKVYTKTIKQASRTNTGSDIILDYRNKSVFSYYEKFIYEGAEWIVVSEIDEDEILSDFYLDYEDTIYNKLNFNNINSPVYNPVNIANNSNDSQKVDVGEYQKASGNTGIYTTGVSTCTAFSAYLPGKFSYLAHITPTDAIYNDDWLHKVKLGEHHTDYVTKLLNKINHYDIRPSQINQLNFILAAPNTNGIRKSINKLLNNNIGLSQIKIYSYPNQTSVDIHISHKTDTVNIIWKKQGAITRIMDQEIPTLSDIVKRQLGFVSI